MKNKRILNAYEPIKPDEESKERMFRNIMSEKNTVKKNSPWKVLLPTVCAAAVLAGVLILPSRSPEASKPETAPIVQAAPSADSPAGMRKFMIYNGYRYAFIENGASYVLNTQDLSQPLGTLEFDIQQDPQAYASKDFASTFALGGTVHEISAYDPAFRIAVELDGNYYICENVDIVSGEPVDAGAYFETAGFADSVQEIQVWDHFGRTQLDTMKKKDISSMLALLSQAEEAQFTNEQYQAIGQAQTTGKSFQLYFQLADSTRYKLYVIPSMNIAMIGDNRYTLTEEFTKEYGSYFKKLEEKQPAQPVPMY